MDVYRRSSLTLDDRRERRTERERGGLFLRKRHLHFFLLVSFSSTVNSCEAKNLDIFSHEHRGTDDQSSQWKI